MKYSRTNNSTNNISCVHNEGHKSQKTQILGACGCSNYCLLLNYLMKRNSNSYTLFPQDVDQLQQLTRKIGRTHPIFCIPVGRNPDMVL